MFTKINVTVDKSLATAIVDMHNIGLREGLGPQSESGYKKWDELVQLVIEKFNLQDLNFRQNGG